MAGQQSTERQQTALCNDVSSLRPSLRLSRRPVFITVRRHVDRVQSQLRRHKRPPQTHTDRHRDIETHYWMSLCLSVWLCLCLFVCLSVCVSLSSSPVNCQRVRSTRGRRFPMGGPLWPCVYRAPLWRYGSSKMMGSRPWPFGVIGQLSARLHLQLLWRQHHHHHVHR